MKHDPRLALWIGDVALRVRGRREHLKLSQVQLAIRAGVSVDGLAKLERAERVPSLATVYKLAQGLGLHPSELIA